MVEPLLILKPCAGNAAQAASMILAPSPHLQVKFPSPSLPTHTAHPLSLFSLPSVLFLCPWHLITCMCVPGRDIGVCGKDVAVSGRDTDVCGPVCARACMCISVPLCVCLPVLVSYTGRVFGGLNPQPCTRAAGGAGGGAGAGEAAGGPAAVRAG